MRRGTRNWLAVIGFIFWLINAGCACVPEMERAPVDDRLMPGDAEPGQINK